MSRSIFGLCVIAQLSLLPSMLPTPARAELTVSLSGLDDQGYLPPDAAYCPASQTDPQDYDISPALHWSAGPAGTRSYVLIMSDLDVPADLSLMNKPNVTLTRDVPRMALIHWLLIDIPPTVTHFEKGQEGSGFVAKGKPTGLTDHGRRGVNAYSHFYPPDSPLAGPRGGYDGPCPPRNDVVAHRYVTEIFAVDVPSLGLSGDFDTAAARERMEGHVLDHGSSVALSGGTR
jgi:phosphatidylethanolamine-binding protein (PEBP) family uncharacterized protein